MWENIINEKMILINPEVSSKDELFNRIVDNAYQQDLILNKKKFLKSLFDRESVANTELIPGIAIPHARTNATHKLFVSIIIIKDGLDYDNPQMGPVRIIFFFGCDEMHAKEYLQLLAHSNRILKKQDFQQKLLLCQSPTEVMNLLAEFSEQKDEETVDNYLLLITLFKPDLTNDVLNSLVELGITNATLIDATSMAKKLAYEMPIFAGLSYMAQSKSKSSSLIFAHIRSRNVTDKLLNLLKGNGVDLNKKGTGFLMTIKADEILGNLDEDIEL